ncbi:hypothetical protein [Allosphingosinicella vermicomposti]|uniref:hypothetical protein n=1 Tax=Allosphingosinicella vermicomposti TaxID=614671 RepID=UPI000D104CC8|nr:hypothetical protein [Allosphingosinicella vermicomposti]
MGKQVLNDVHGSTRPKQKQDNVMPDDPEDGGRKSFIAGRDGGKAPVKKAPEQDQQDRSTIEVFGEEGAGKAPKE